MRIRVAKDLVADLFFVANHIVPAVAEVVGNGLARGQDRIRRGLGNSCGDRLCFLHQTSARHDLGDQPELIGYGRIKIFADKKNVEHPVAPDQPRQAAQTHAPARHQSEISVAGAENRVIASHPNIANPTDGGAAADAITVNGRDDRNAELLDAVERSAPHLAEGALRPRILERAFLAQIRAGTEGALACAGQDDAAHVAHRFNFVQSRVKHRDEPGRDRIDRRIVQRERDDCAVALAVNRWICQETLLCEGQGPSAPNRSGSAQKTSRRWKKRTRPCSVMPSTARTTRMPNIPEISMLKLSCINKLPSPRSAPINSPTSAPVMLNTIATLRPAKMKGSELGNTTMRNSCQRDATSDRISSIFSASIVEKPTMALINTGKKEMIAAIVILDSMPIPTHTTMSEAGATLGSA